MRVEDKHQVLRRITSEDELRTELVIPLLRKMPGVFSDVLDNQGANEAGVDVIGVSASPFRKPEYTAVVLKLGDITLKAADQRNNLVNTVETQIREAVLHPLTHPRLPQDSAFANRVVVITNGTISRNAENALAKTYGLRSDISLDFIGRDRLIESIDQYWPEFYDDRRPFLSTYAKKLFESLNVVNLELLGYSNRNRTLSDIYIDTLLVPRDGIDAHDDLVLRSEYVTGHSICTAKHKLCVITSGPGGGKSTLLKELAIHQSKADSECVAVYLHGRDILEAPTVRQAAVVALTRLSSEKREDVSEAVETARLHIMVDGLDEIASQGDRIKIVRLLREEADTNETRVTIGTRPESNPSLVAALGDFAAYTIAPLRLGQIRSFFGKWFKDNTRAAKLLEAMKDKGVLDKLPRTPMTMTLVAIVFESKEDLPANLTQLYEMFVDLLTGKWDANRQISSPFDSPIKLGFLSYLAWRMHSERLEVISQDRCIEMTREFFSNYATISGVDERGFIQTVIDRSHILIPTGYDQIRFSHMTFQEFFCAEWLSGKDSNPDVIVGWFGDDWWSEVLFFLAGKRKDITELVQRLLRENYSDSNTRLTKLIALGSMLQAGFLTSAPMKAQAIEFASRHLIACYEDLFEAIQTAVAKNLHAKYSRFMLIGVLQNLFASNFTSKYLKSALLEVYDQLKDDRTDIGTAARFFIACSLERLDSRDCLLEFASDPRMIDTSMFLISRALLKDEISEGERERFKKVLKRQRDFKEAIRRELRRF